MDDSRIRLILLDFDGTLADTRRANTLAYVAALGEAGYTLTEEEYTTNYFGMRCEEFLTRFGIADPAERERLRRRKIELYPTFFDTVRLNRPLWEFCRQFQSRGGRVWIVSTGSRDNIDNVMPEAPPTIRHQKTLPPAASEQPLPKTDARSDGSTAFSQAPTSNGRNRLPTVFWKSCAAKAARRAKPSSSKTRPSASKPHTGAEPPTSSSGSESRPAAAPEGHAGSFRHRQVPDPVRAMTGPGDQNPNARSPGPLPVVLTGLPGTAGRTLVILRRFGRLLFPGLFRLFRLGVMAPVARRWRDLVRRAVRRTMTGRAMHATGR